MISRATALLGMMAMASSCNSEPAAAPPSSPDAVFSASDRRCRLLVSWAIAPTDVVAVPAKVGERARETNRIRLDAGNNLYWNKAPVDRLRSLQFLDRSRMVAPQPMTIVQADRRANCAALRIVIADTDKALDCSRPMCRFEWAEIPVDPNRGAPVSLPMYPL